MKEIAIKCMLYVEVNDGFDDEQTEDFSYELLNTICDNDYISYQYFESRIEEVDD